MARGRKPSYPKEICDLLNISIDKFSVKGYLKPFTCSNGTLSFRDSKVDFTLFIEEKSGVLCIDFGTYQQEIPIISKKSNLGNGLIWFFKCSETGSNARKLYLHKGKFIHRKGIPFNYPAQNLGKNWRFIRQLLRREQGLDIPDFKREYYNNKPTKDYLRFLKAVQKANISEAEKSKLKSIMNI